MTPPPSLKTRLAERIDDLRLQAARPDALIQLSIAGLITGLLTGIVIVGFVSLIDITLGFWLPDNDPENFEALPQWLRILLPIGGAALLGLLFSRLSKEDHIVGIVHVLERLRYHEGYLKLKGFALQFIAASIALISGQSLGREGPAIHLGAAMGSTFGQAIGMPNNVIRTLIACGAAGAIGAAFNTPLAGVIFAMEIIIAEYTVASFIPIIISAVAATGIARFFLGNELALSDITITPTSIYEVPSFILLGIAIGITSSLFTIAIRHISGWCRDIHVMPRFLIAGFATSMLALLAPQLMGLGYDTVANTINNQLPMTLLAIILITKLLATAISIGCGMPAGLISPSLVIGATGGALLAGLLKDTSLIQEPNTGLYALVGMSAMMGACLQAPLAALTAVFEITANPQVIWPSMLAIVIAQLVSQQLFKQAPVFNMLLSVRGLNISEDPFHQTLQRTGIAKIMNRDVVALPTIIEPNLARQKLHNTPQWILLEKDHQPVSLLRGVDLFHYLEDKPKDTAIDLALIPGKRLDVTTIDVRATLAKAKQLFQQENCEALCVIHWNPRSHKRIYGVVARGQFEKLYLG